MLEYRHLGVRYVNNTLYCCYSLPNIAIYLNSLGAREGAGSDDSIDWTLVFGDDDIFQNVAMLYGETWKEYTYTLSKLATIDKIITGSLNYSVATLEEELNNYNLEEQVPEWMELLEEAYGTSFREGEPGALYVRIGSKWEPATIDNLWPEAKTIIIFHGLANSYKEDWIAVMADNLKMKEPGANVMAVDWARYANWLGGTWSAVLFAEAATHIPEVARKVSDNIYGLGLHHVAWKMHFIGHSHGAHVAGLTAKYMLLQIERLTALDASEELAHWRTLKNYGGLGWNKNVAKFTDYYKSSAIMGSERDYGHHNFLLVENTYAWGDTFREYKPTNHGFSINWFTGTIIHNSTYGYYWNENEWGNLKDNITLLSAHEGPWLGLIRGDWNGNGTIETLSLATDKARYTHTWNYPGAWQEVTKLLDSLERAVEMEPHDLSIEILESDSKLKYGGQCILRYSVTNNADNISIDYRKRHASQMGAENRLPVVDSLWLSKNNLLEPPRDYPLNILAHNQILLDPQNPVAGWKQVFLGAEGESNSTQSFEVVLTIPGKDELQSYFEDNTNDEYYILVDAGSTLSQAYRYAEELYPSNNISFPLYITLDDETLSADAGGIYWVTDENGNGVEVVELDGSNSAPSDKIVSYDWNIGVSGVIANYEFSVGEQAITLTVTDLNGNTDTDEALIIVRPKSDIPDGSPEDGDSTITRRPVDPEDKFGPAGYDPPGTLEAEMKRYISDDESMSYHIEFWNHEDAEVPARVVTMRDTLDLAVFDLSTLEFTRIGFLKWDIDLPPGTKAIDRRIDLRPDMDLVIDVTTTVDYETGLVMWRFQCSDPLTGYYPEDPMAGFLPPFNKETGYELGWIEFRVKPVAVMTTGTVIANRAYGEFDDMGDWPKNPAPKEGPWINTVDAGLPTSHVLPLPKISTRHFLVNWEGEDAVEGSGIGLYEIHVSENGTPYSLWLSTSETSAIYEGNLNSTYSFYSIAKDNVGNREEPPSEPDTVTTVELLSPNLDDNMIVNLNDLSLFVEEWLSHDCYINNDWCSYCDFNQDGIVNFKDLSLMAEDWMQLEE